MAKFHALKKRWGTASDKVLQKMLIIFQFSYQIYIIDFLSYFKQKLVKIIQINSMEVAWLYLEAIKIQQICMENWQLTSRMGQLVSKKVEKMYLHIVNDTIYNRFFEYLFFI